MIHVQIFTLSFVNILKYQKSQFWKKVHSSLNKDLFKIDAKRKLLESLKLAKAYEKKVCRHC